MGADLYNTKRVPQHHDNHVMETESIVNEPPHGTRGFSTEKSASMTILSPQGKAHQQQQQQQQQQQHHPPRVTQLESLEAKMASIEVSLSTATPRRRKGTSLGGGSLSARSSPRPDSAPNRELRTALQDREAVIQNLRLQLGLGKLPRPTGPAFDDVDRPVAEQRLSKLRSEADNKKVAIRNLKSALEKLDITDNIDIRIRQAELEYALGREELQMLSLVEEARALQARLEKPKQEASSLFGILQSGVNLTLHALKSTPGRWNASMKTEFPGFWVDWALDGEGLQRGDRIIEVNGKIVPGRTREELQKLMGTVGKCEMVVLRKKSLPFSQQQLQQTQADNVRLQHRISYLEDQVKELSTRDNNTDSGSSQASIINGSGGAHVTSISITSPPSTPPDNKPQIYQRGSFVTTIIDGKPAKIPPNNEFPKTHHGHVTTTTIIKECDKINGELTSGNVLKHNLRNSISSSKISINSDMSSSTAQYYQKKERDKREREARRLERERYMQQYGTKLQRSTIDLGSDPERRHLHYHRNHARSVEYLNGTSEKRKLALASESSSSRREMRSVKSLDFESDNNEQYASEPSGPMKTRPAPPKKPLRLSLQRAQSLQTVEGILIDAAGDKKRAMKRSHRSGKNTGLASQYIENNIPLQTASLGRQKYI